MSISGRLTTDDGNGLQNGLIYIKDEDTGSGDDDIALLCTLMLRGNSTTHGPPGQWTRLTMSLKSMPSLRDHPVLIVLVARRSISG